MLAYNNINKKNNSTMEKKNVQLTLEQARELYKQEKWCDIILNSFTKEELMILLLKIQIMAYIMNGLPTNDFN